MSLGEGGGNCARKKDITVLFKSGKGGVGGLIPSTNQVFQEEQMPLTAFEAQCGLEWQRVKKRGQSRVCTDFQVNSILK